MQAVDNSYEAVRLDPVWRDIGARIGAGAGASIALLSLFHDVPVSVAALRGTATLLSIWIVWRVGLTALERAVQIDARNVVAEPEGEDQQA